MLAILRGHEGAAGGRGVADDFARLRDLARAGGYPVLPVGTPYVGASELMLLSWLAVAQRVVAPGCQAPSQDDLASVISTCAERLSAKGLRLYPLTLYAHRLREFAKT
ncbi:hypothetical protein [Novosphingobium guangzhouense]|uniref:hypothetical protein n=1 Tax=Novosphingobium guangzhouense TaxID=1850347 RepID=UPI0011AF2B3D|nr:hypothetical protein [Novosphingobium guangzhouense]